MNAQILTESRACEVEQLERTLRDQLNGRVRNFRLIQRVGGVVLQGWATSYYAKQVAQHAVMAAIALPIVANNIEVAETLVDDDD